jgi:hypothetical protein
MREAVDMDSFPSPAFSHSDSMSRIDSPLTNAPITIARSGSVRNTFVLHAKQLGDKRPGRLADLRDLDLEFPLGGLHPAGPKPVAQPRLMVAQPALILGPALIPGAAKPGVELVLNGALDDQPGPQPGQLRQRLARVLTHPTESSRSICSSISADGGTVRLTA